MFTIQSTLEYILSIYFPPSTSVADVQLSNLRNVTVSYHTKCSNNPEVFCVLTYISGCLVVAEHLVSCLPDSVSAAIDSSSVGAVFCDGLASYMSYMDMLTQLWDRISGVDDCEYVKGILLKSWVRMFQLSSSTLCESTISLEHHTTLDNTDKSILMLVYQELHRVSVWNLAEHVSCAYPIV